MMRILFLLYIIFIVNFTVSGQFSSNQISTDYIFGLSVSDITINNSDSLFKKYSFKKPKKNFRTINWRDRGCSIQRISKHYLKFKKNKLTLSIVESDGKTRIKLTVLKHGNDLVFKDVIIGKTKPIEIEGYEKKWEFGDEQFIEYEGAILGILLNEDHDWTESSIVSIEI